jgi:hypothetical protein
MKRAQSAVPLDTRLSRALRGLTVAVIAAAAAGLSALIPVAAPPASAQEIKLDAPCSSLNLLDVTKVDNPQCKAVTAIYFDAGGTAIYQERLVLDQEQLVSGRLVRVVPPCDPNTPDCGGQCKTGCSMILGGRLVCIC